MECFVKGSPITIIDLTMLGLKSTEVGKGSIGLTYTADLPGLECHVEGAAIPFTYTVGSSTINITKGPLKTTPAACGTVTLDADFSLEIGATAVILD